MDPNQIPPPPDGSGVVSTGSSSIPPPPDGSAVMSSQPNQPQPAATTPPAPPEPSLADKVNEVGDNLAKGVGKGVLQTTSGLGNIIHKVGEYVHPGLGEAIIPQSGLTAEEGYSHPHGVAQHIGVGGESIAEFLLGDEALKGLTMAEKFTQVAKTMKMAENSPRLMKALKIGADAARMGAVQGVQTGVKTGGDVGAAAESGLIGAGTAGVLGGVGAALGKGASAVGKAGTKVQELGDVAANAAPKAEISSQLADKINSSEDLLKSNYGDKLKDFVARTDGTTVPYADSPWHKSVQDVIGKGENDSTPFDEALRKSRPGSARVNQTLEDLDALGKPPETAKPETWVDNRGTTHTEPVQKVGAEPINLDMKTLLGQRALLGERIRQIKGVSSEDLADKQVYGKLMDGVDDTIDDLVGKAKDPEVSDEYQDLRQNYKEHVNLYQDPVVKAITNPKGAPDDAARAFVGLVNKSGLPQAGKVQQSLSTLQKVLDPLGKEGDKPLKDFGSQVFHTMLADAAHEGNFNASKFMDTWGRIDPATKDKLFGVGTLPEGAEGPQTLIDSLSHDAKDVRNIQRLTRVGLLSTGGLPFHATGLGAIGLLALINENAGVQAGRNTLDFIANHPAVWKAFRGLSHVAESPITKGVGEATQKVATNAAGRATEPDEPTPNPNQGSDQQPVVSPAPDTTFDNGPQAGKPISGLVQKGNIDVNHRPSITNADGSHSSIFSMTVPVNKDGSVFTGKYEDAPQYALVPSIANGKFLTPDGKKPNERNRKQMSQLEDAATEHYAKTKQHLGIFKTGDDADKYAGLTHAYMNDGTDKKVYAPSPESK